MIVFAIALRFRFFALAADVAPVALDGNTLQALWTAFASHSYMMAGALFTGALVALAKQGWLSTWIAARLPSRFLPFVALAIGTLGTMSAEVVAGWPWQKALLDGVAAAMGAVFGHQALIEGMRQGKEIVPPTKAVVALAHDADTHPGHG